MKNGFSIRTGLAVLVMATALPFVAYIAYDAYEESEIVVEHASAETLRAAQATATEAEDALNRARELLAILAKRPAIKSLDAEHCAPIFSAFGEFYPEYTNLLTVRRNGERVCSAVTPPPGASPTVDANLYLAQTLRTRAFAVGPVIRGAFGGRWIAIAAYPLQGDGGEAAGVVAVAIDLAKLPLARRATQLPPQAEARVVDVRGTVIASNVDPDKLIGQNVAEVPWFNLLEPGRSSTGYAADATGVERIYGSVPIAGTSWHSVVGIPVAAVYGPWRQQVLESTAFSLAGLLFAALLAYLVARRAARPVEEIAAAVREATQSAAHVEIIAADYPAAPRELQTLAGTFRTMLKARAGAERLIRESAAGLHRAQLIAKLAHVVTAPDGTFESWSDTLAPMIGVRPEAVPRTTRDWMARVHPDDSAGFRARAIEAGRAGARSEFEYRFRCGDGSWIHVRQVSEPLSGADQASGKPRWFGTLQDITSLKRAQEEQRSVGQLLDNIVENIPTAVQLKSVKDGYRIVMWNKASEAVFGVPREEAIGRNVHDLWPKDAADRFHAADLDLIASGQMQDFPDRPAQTKDRGEIRVHMRKVALFDAAGKPTHLLVIADDITAQLADQVRLRESEARFRSLTELSADWFWEQDQEHRFVDFSGGDSAGGWGPDQSKAVGLRRWELPGVEPVSGSWAEHRALVEAHLPFRNFEYKRVLGDGALQYVAASGEPVFDAGGRFTGYRGVAADISQRKRAEHDLQRFRAAMDISGDAVVLIDRASLRYIDVNQATCNMTGFSRQELLGMTPMELFGVPREPLERDYDAIIADRNSSATTSESVFRHRDGSVIPIETRRRAMQADGRWIIVGIARDISERKRADERIRRLNRVYAMLSGINALIVRVNDRDELFREACRVAVETGGFLLAWAGVVGAAADDIQVVSWHGDGEGYVERMPVGAGRRADPDNLSVLAVTQRKAMISHDMTKDPRIRLQKESEQRGFHSLAILPLLSADRAVGVLALYAGEVGFFDDEELKLLHELAGDIAFALDHLEKAERLKIESAERWRAESSVKRLNRVHAVLSGINALIVRVRDRDELFRESCRVAVEAGGFPLAWMGIVDREAMLVKPVAWHGTGPDYADYIGKMRLGTNDAVPEGRGLAGRAVRDRKAVIANDIARDPRITMKQDAYQRGFHSLVILPLLVADEVVGVLAMYVGETGFFDEEEMKLLHELAGDIAFAIDHIEKASRLDYLAYYDSLTGLANRTLFHERLTQHISAASTSGSKVAVVVVDIERFRMINDSLGRQAGDTLLKQIAERLGRAAGQTEVARSGSDHFAIVLPQMKGRSEIGRTVDGFWQSCLDEPFTLNGTEMRVAMKGGIALYPSDGASAETLFKNAEAAWKKAKASGERYLFHAPEMTARIAENLTLENKLRQALEKEEFVLHYQPKVDLQTRRIVGVEALIRWNNPERGLVPPGQFIPLLEETGLILQVGQWALRRAARDHSQWLQEGVAAPRIAVNVSAIQLRQRDFVEVVKAAVGGHTSPTGIDIEITESLLMDDVAGNITKLKALRDMGMKISIDDFGTGYSSLGYLAKLPVHTLKIDRSFIITMLDEPDTMTLISTIISLAHSLRLSVVAEGVEEEEQAKMLRLLRCDEMQGYLFSKPVPVEQLMPLLRKA